MHRLSSVRRSDPLAIKESTTIPTPIAENSGPGQPDPSCGIIMPISATERFSAEHWRDVNVLAHRCIKAAGFTPKNVWENSSADRVSERIIGNIFECTIVVADISDLNPNVMLEVGLRLASKKPTIVTMASESVMPFDLRDFHAIDYPANLNILGMEGFFQRLSKVLRDKMAAVGSDTYVPFLGHVIVDVISPEKREVGPDQLVLKRLEEMNSTLEKTLAATRGRDATTRASRRVVLRDKDGVAVVYLPNDRFDSFQEAAIQMFEVDNIQHSSMGAETRARVRYSGCTDLEEFSSALHEVVSQHDGRIRLPPLPASAASQ